MHTGNPVIHFVLRGQIYFKSRNRDTTRPFRTGKIIGIRLLIQVHQYNILHVTLEEMTRAPSMIGYVFTSHSHLHSREKGGSKSRRGF